MNSSIAPLPAAAAAALQKCILLVEDEMLIRLMLSDELRDAGYQVIEACSVEEALAVLDSAPFDLIVSDVYMPGPLDGLALLGVVRSRFPDLPVIMMSGQLQAGQALSAGATRFFVKPFAVEKLLAAVSEELGLSE